ncbi:hypothetical protein JHK85_008781 [Glycine max]|nr:hypothetical protein JHK85_008781 [Glycine max]
MAKKRSAPSGGRRENRAESSSRRLNSASGRRKLVAFFIVSSIIAIVTYRYRFRQSSPSQGLVTTHANCQHILATSLVLEGRHNADRGWISELKKAGEALILPRVVLEASPAVLLGKEKQRNKAINLIVTECKEMGYDGIVLESWSRWAAYGILHDPSMRNLALQFVKQLGDALHSISSEKISGQQLQLVYVIGPPSEKLQEHDFGPKDLETLSEAVDGFSLMTYDFSNPHNPGPNAPLKWIQIVLQLLLGTSGNRAQSLAPKILLGINFYGNDFSLSRGNSFVSCLRNPLHVWSEGNEGVKVKNADAGGGAIIGRDYLALLEKHWPELQWDKNSGEHFFFYTDDKDIRHVVFYPSLKSISLRLEEARSWGCGISIWEIGQAYISSLKHPLIWHISSSLWLVESNSATTGLSCN